MRRGLHIGIASWIHAQRGAGRSLALPATAIPFELRLPHEIETPQDIAGLSELAHFANRLGDGSWRYETSTAVDLLWDRYRQIVADMQTAVSALTPQEQDQLDAANAVLFGDDGFTISDKYALFLEARTNHEELVIAGAPAEEVAAAFEAWVTIGHKKVIQEAIATKTTLSNVTSRVVVADDINKIEHALESGGAVTPYVPTQFVPISATSTEHWTEAEVDFQTLEDSIGPHIPRSEWNVFRGTKTGRVRLRFASVDLIRPWFSNSVFGADDWRLDDDEMVADGLGGSGRLPSYYSDLYMAQVLDVRNDTVKPKRPPRVSHAGNKVVMHHIKPSRMLLAHPGLFSHTLRRGTKSAATRGTTLQTLSASQAVTTSRVSIAPLLTPVTVKPKFHAAHLVSAGRFAHINLLTASLAAQKLNFAVTALSSGGSRKPPQAKPTWLVGFGSTNVPSCPNPNPNYQWA